MSMRDCPSSGWTVEVEKFLPHMTDAEKTIYEDIATFDAEAYEGLMENVLKRLGIEDFSVLILDGDDQSDDIKKDFPYVVFPFTSLYSLIPKEGMVNLQKLEITPVHNHWSIFG